MATHETIHENWLGFSAESTVCQPVADPAASATWIEHITFDTAGIKQAMIDDMTLETRAFAVGTRHVRKGLRNGQISATLKLHGTGVETADGVQVAQTYIGSILGHCMGGVHRGTSHLVVDGTATEVELAAVTGIIPGCMLAFEDTTSPTEQYEGKPQPRRVIAVDAGTKVVTLSEELPFVPAAGDIAHPCITPYLVSSVLKNAVAGPTTYHWYIKKAESNTDLLYTLEGSVASMKIENIGRGQLPTIGLDVMFANFRHGAGDGLDTSWAPTTFVGHAQLAMGLDAQVAISEYGDDTYNPLDANNATFEPGFTRVRVETQTEKIDRFQGTATYSFAPGMTKFTCTVTPYDIEWYNGLAAEKEYRISLFQPGDGTGAGKGWVLHMGRAQLVNTPARVDMNENHAVTLEFRAMEPDDCTGGSNVNLEKTRFTLAIF